MSGNSVTKTVVPKPSVPPFTHFLAPKFWLTWLGIALLVLIAYLPFRLRMFTGHCLGIILYSLARERRYITQTNIAICFPERSAQQQAKLVRDCFIENGIGLIETAVGWVRNPRHFQHLLKINNAEAMQTALAKGKGVILLGAHYTTLDFSANLASLQYPFAVTYRPHKNPLFDAFMLKGRLKNCNGVFDRYDIRGTLRHLKKNNIIWYAPDQDYGPEHAVFAPFFGRQAATITAASRLAGFYDSPVLLVRHHRMSGSQPYEVEFIPFPESFPGDDEVADATYMNKQLEVAIRVQPAQYLWMHKRFKTQANGKPDSPYILVKTPVHKIDRQSFNTMIEGTKVIEEQHIKNLTRQLDNDVLFRILPSSDTRFFAAPPMKLFDLNSRLLRAKGIGSVTVDSLFIIKKADFMAATYFPLPGTGLQKISPEEIDLKALAAFLDQVHQGGFYFNEIRPAKLLYDEARFYIANPEELRVFPSSICFADRCDNIQLLLNKLELSQIQRAQFIELYTELSGLKNEPAFTQLFSRLLASR